MSGIETGIPIEQFIQAVTSQLDRAQATMAMKARAGLPLTFAVKDLSIDFRTHIDMVDSVVRIRPAGPNEPDASTIHLALTSITRPMIEENTMEFVADPDEPSLREVMGDDFTEDEQRRLEWAGIHSVSQLREVQRQTSEEAIQKFTQLPIHRLRQALQHANRPRISRISREPEAPTPGRPPMGTGPSVSPPLSREPSVWIPAGSAPSATLPASKGPSVSTPPPARAPVLRIRGNNLMRGGHPRVSIRGERLPVIRASERELLVASRPNLLSGTLSIEVEPGEVVEAEFDLEAPHDVPHETLPEAVVEPNVESVTPLEPAPAPESDPDPAPASSATPAPNEGDVEGAAT